MITVKVSSLKYAGLGLVLLVVLAIAFGLGIVLGGRSQAQAPAAVEVPPAATAEATPPQTGPAATADAVRREASAYYVKGRAAYEAEKFDEAIADLTAAIQLKPDLAFAYLFRGLAYARSGDNALAIKDLETYLEISSDGINAGQIQRLIERLKGEE